MVNEIVVVWLVDPLVPLMVMVRVPVLARVRALMVTVEVPAPVMDVGLNEMAVPLPCPDADRAMAELKPPDTAVVTVTVPEATR